MIFGEGPIIKNIAGDLNKLFLQGTRAAQSIINVEGDAAADQGTVDLLAAMDPVIQEVAVGMSGEQAARYTVTGQPPLLISNSLGKPLTSWSVDVSPYQEGTGDPSPNNVRAIHGTDKINIVTAEENLLPSYFMQGSALIIGQLDRVVSQILIPVIANNTYTFSASDYTNFMYVLNSGENNRLPFPASPSVSYQWCGHNVQWVQHDITFTATRSGYLAVVVRRPANGAITPADISSIKMKFEMSAVSTDWTPNAVSTILTLSQTAYTATIGSGGGESRWGEVDLGALTWTQGSFAGVTGYYTQAPLDIKQVANGQAFNGQAETLSIIRFNAIGTKQYAISLRDIGLFYVNSDVAPSGKLVYELSAPATFAVTAPDIPTPRGDSTAWATTEDGTVDGMEVTYVGKA